MSRSTSKSAERGFTLVELMIALVLGLVVIGGVISVLLSNQQTYRSNQALSQVQDASRTAFEFLARDIRQAGLTGCGSSVPVTNVLNSTAWWATWNNNSTLIGYDNAAADPALSSFTGNGAPVAGTDSIQAIGASANSNSLNGGYSDAGTAAAFNETGSALTPISAGDIIIACNSNQVAIFQYQGGSPGNTSNTFSPLANNSLFAKLNASDWYIGNNALGACSAAQPQNCSLFRSAISVSGGNASAQAQEIVRGVSNMQLQYLIQGSTTNLALKDTWQPATTVTSNNEWSNVTAVRVTLTMAVPANPNNATDPNNVVQRSFTNTVTVRNRVN